MRISAEKSLNVLLIIVCLVVGANATVQLLERVHLLARPQQPISAAAPRAGAPPPETYQPGDTLPVVDDYSYSASDKTLVLMVRSTCTFCTQSMPFYRRLAEKAQQGQRPTRLLAVSTESREVVGTYLKSHNVPIDNFRSVPSSYMRIVGTPTLVLVDSTGKVRNTWIGLQQKDQEDEILSALDNQ